MKTFIAIFSLLVTTTLVNGQADAGAYYGNKYIAARMGGGRPVKYDTVTPLDGLIKKLTNSWEFNETGKGYWIGYTDDMYSIARYKDKAIEKLTNFIDTSRDLHAKEGALYTIHLIGINFRVVGRFLEDFENRIARNALLKYLDDNQLNETVVLLIKRDPWLSDLPKLMQYLSEPNHDYSRVLVALQRYSFNEKPLGQKVTDSIFDKYVLVNDFRLSALSSTKTLLSLKNDLAPNFIIDTEITATSDWQKAVESLNFDASRNIKISFNDILRDIHVFSYCEYEPSYDYVVKDNSIEIIGPKKARQIWLDWWQTLPQDEKDKFIQSNHIN